MSFLAKLATKVLQVGTLGMVNVNPQSGNVILKDPITGIGNTLAEAKDAAFKDFGKGVWIGKRSIKGAGVGFSSYVTEHLNMNVLHYAVRVDGLSWTVEQSLQHSTIRVVELTESYAQEFEWFFKGETVNSVSALVDEINQEDLEFKFMSCNSGDIAKGIYMYARGLITKQEFRTGGFLTNVGHETANLFK